jgi:peptidoglycan/xylan/chitin deacetylase (PgdA/CDA1 family)
VSFGSHTARHPLLTTVTEAEAKEELRQSMTALIDHKAADSNFMCFSYPNGSLSGRLSEMVREAGYHLAVTTRYGWHSQGSDAYTIPRIAMHQDITSTTAMFESRIVNSL